LSLTEAGPFRILGVAKDAPPQPMLPAAIPSRGSCDDEPHPYPRHDVLLPNAPREHAASVRW